jgi:IK cytokine
MKSNDSFRKLLEETRTAPEKKAAEPITANGPKKKSQGSEKYRRLLEQKAKQKEIAESGPAYRDRADERRKDNTDIPVEEAALATVDIEMSKYLGGDMSHTHLVKGLDYALLNKVKSTKDTFSSSPLSFVVLKYIISAYVHYLALPGELDKKDTSLATETNENRKEIRKTAKVFFLFSPCCL